MSISDLELCANQGRSLRLCVGDRSVSHPRFDKLIRFFREQRLDNGSGLFADTMKK